MRRYQKHRIICSCFAVPCAITFKKSGTSHKRNMATAFYCLGLEKEYEGRIARTRSWTHHGGRLPVHTLLHDEFPFLVRERFPWSVVLIYLLFSIMSCHETKNVRDESHVLFLFSFQIHIRISCFRGQTNSVLTLCGQIAANKQLRCAKAI